MNSCTKESDSVLHILVVIFKGAFCGIILSIDRKSVSVEQQIIVAARVINRINIFIVLYYFCVLLQRAKFGRIK